MSSKPAWATHWDNILKKKKKVEEKKKEGKKKQTKNLMLIKQSIESQVKMSLKMFLAHVC